MRDQETQVITLHGLSAHDNKLLRALHEKTGKFVAQNVLNFVRLFDAETHAN